MTASAESQTSSASQSDHLNNHDIHEIEQLTNELKRLLVSHEDTLNDEGIRREVEMLERWMESYRRGLSAAHKISETGTTILNDLRNHLKLAINERHRLEDEGGNPSTKDDSRKLNDLADTMHHIESMLPDLQHAFHAIEPEPEDA